MTPTSPGTFRAAVERALITAGAVLVLVATALGAGGCDTFRPIRPVKTQIVEVPVETQVTLDPALTAQEPEPARPADRCVDAQARPTICNKDLIDWLNAYAAALRRINGRMLEIFGLQPKAAP